LKSYLNSADLRLEHEDPLFGCHPCESRDPVTPAQATKTKQGLLDCPVKPGNDNSEQLCDAPPLEILDPSP